MPVEKTTLEERWASVAAWRWHHLSARPFCVDQRWTIRPRRLEDVFIFLPEAGSAHMRCAGRACELGPGRCLVLPERCEHSARMATGCRRFRVLALHGLLRLRDGRPVVGLFDRLLHDVPERRAWCRRFRQLCQLEAVDPAAAGRLAEALVPAFLAELAVTATPAPAPPVPDHRLRPALDRLHGDPATELSIGELAQRCGLRPVRFRQLFQAATGRSPKAYQSSLRLDRAARLLSHGDWPVRQVAAAVGYADSRWFARHFRERFGCRPSTYRQRMADEGDPL